MDVSGKYERFTEEQMEALERLYHDCPKPSSIRLQQLIWEAPVLASIEPKQIKVWFQNRRRCREKQQKKKEPTRSLVSMNAKLTALNKLLVEENERLARHTSQLTLDNRMLRQQLHDLPPAAPGPDTQHSLLLNQEIRHQMKEERVNEEDSLLNALKDGGGDEKNTPQDHLSLQPIPGQNYYGVAAASTDDGSSDSVITVVGLPQNSTLQHYPPQDVHSAGRLLAVTDEMTLTEFLAKATRTVVDWIQLPSMKVVYAAVSLSDLSSAAVLIAMAECFGVESVKSLVKTNGERSGNRGGVCGLVRMPLASFLQFHMVVPVLWCEHVDSCILNPPKVVEVLKD